MRTFLDLTKFGIVISVVLSAVAGYAMGFQIESPFFLRDFLLSLLGVYFLSSGSLALNQAQEYRLDQQMKRTAKRPIAAGILSPRRGYLIATILLVFGTFFLYFYSTIAGHLGVLTVLLYNGVYTYYWKPKWAFGAVPGAIPGALPVSIGYALATTDIWNGEFLYLFLVMFLWQMPHFWCLAIRFKDDYQSGGVPTLPVSLGMEKALVHTGAWTFLYVGCALASPWFVRASWFYILLVVPFSVWILREFFRFYSSKGAENWFSFFMVTNVSLLVFLFVPVIDKWNFLFIDHN